MDAHCIFFLKNSNANSNVQIWNPYKVLKEKNITLIIIHLYFDHKSNNFLLVNNFFKINVYFDNNLKILRDVMFLTVL